MKHSPDLTLRIRMHATHCGGRENPTPQNKFKCILKVINEYHDCMLLLDKSGPLTPGESAIVDAILLMPDSVRSRLSQGQEVTLCEGKKEIATGIIVRTFSP